MADKTKVLHVLHNHPSLYPGGPERYGLELHEAMQRSEEFESLLVARVGSEAEESRRHRPGAPFRSLDGNPAQSLVVLEHGGFDFLDLTYRDKSVYTFHFAEFLRGHRPDVVHLQHPLFIGSEVATIARRVVPSAVIVQTLHDYTHICHRDGKFVRTRSEALCSHASPRRCHECFPEISEESFFLRERFIKGHLRHVDAFLAPNRFVLNRYLEWGLPPEKLHIQELGFPSLGVATDPYEDRPRTRLGFFGELSPYKGLDVLLQSMTLVRDADPPVELRIFGRNLWKYSDEHQARFAELLQQAGDNTVFAGLDWSDEVGSSWGLANAHPRTLTDVMLQVDWVVVPSRWWEGSAFIVLEAFRHRRPVICSGIGALADLVTHGMNGLHYPGSGPGDLAAVLRTATATPGLWERLREGIPTVQSMDEHLQDLSGIYRQCLQAA